MADNTENDLLEPSFPPTEWGEVAPVGWAEPPDAELGGDEYLIQDDYVPGWEAAMQEEPVRELSAEEAGTDFTQEEQFERPPDEEGAGGLPEIPFETIPQEQEELLPMSDVPQSYELPYEEQVLAEEPDPRRMAVEAAKLEEQRNQAAATAIQEEISNQEIANQQALADKESRDYLIEMDRRRMEQERVNLMQEKPDMAHWWKNADTMQKIGAGMAAIFGGALSVFQGGRNMGLEVVMHAIDQDLESQMFDIQNRRGLINEQLGGIQDRLATSDNTYRTKMAAQVAAYEKVKERIQAEMITLDPRGSAFSAMRQTLFQVDMKIAQAQQNAAKNAFERAKAEVERQAKVRDQDIKLKEISAENYRAGLASRTTQRGQDLTLIQHMEEMDKDRMKIATEIAMKGKEDEAKDYARNGLPNVVAVRQVKDPATGKMVTVKQRILTPEGMDELHGELLKKMAGREMLQSSIKKLKALYKQPGGATEWWNAAPEAERAELIQQYGKLKGQRQQTKEEIMLSGQASGRPPGWLGELRKEPKVLDRLSQIADNEVIASLKAGIRPGYEGADFEFIDQRLGPEGREGLTEPPELEGITFEPGVVDMSHPFKDKNKPSPIGRWWEDERDQGRMNALIAISKNVDKTKGLGKIHLERGLEDTRNFNRKIAAGALGKVVNGKTVGDPQSVPRLEELANTDPDPTVRAEARRAANKIKESYADEFKKKDQSSDEYAPPPSYKYGTGGSAGVGVKVDIPTLSPEEYEQKRQRAYDYMNKSRVK
jgi:hypothetical protein